MFIHECINAIINIFIQFIIRMNIDIWPWFSRCTSLIHMCIHVIMNKCVILHLYNDMVWPWSSRHTWCWGGRLRGTPGCPPARTPQSGCPRKWRMAWGWGGGGDTGSAFKLPKLYQTIGNKTTTQRPGVTQETSAQWGTHQTQKVRIPNVYECCYC